MKNNNCKTKPSATLLRTCYNETLMFYFFISFPQERKESGKRGRKPGRKAGAEKVDMKAKLERSRQSARECRARKKLRYQYLEELVADREKAVVELRQELEKYQYWSQEIDSGRFPEDAADILKEFGIVKPE